ncbi:ornithine-acyl[acyl carrier protein] N-acyltransferase [Martelella mediterranea]|uniref:L-ornithine N(alpha)-acyltransferase n=2 Tax=Martelella mediterranea TaxID=293089 RepID=A0A4V2V4T9_9HYPH|nr:GNAT family N-acetyltransferase [Martelella mediterranea]TCT43032.1 ornithine-acyl[acyl carrier protein] N-acyltransferase [Martelella mediterranea]
MTMDVLDYLQSGDRAGGAAITPEDIARDGILGRIGTLETRIARSQSEIEAAQSVRYRVFVEEMQAQLPAEAMRCRRDFDKWDDICDHLLVLDRKIEGDTEDQIVATYRLLRHEVALAHGGFYSDSEYRTDQLVARHPDLRFMELGRSCVLPEYRSKRTVELLWQGNWAYALKHHIGAMFGCASFHGAIPEAHAMALSFLYHNARATGEWAVEALPGIKVDMNMMAAEEVSGRKALTALPPLIKGYLRLGAMVGEGAVVDHAFNTTDVLVILPIAAISDRYLNYYGADAGRFAS